jgi:phosphate:Na+ symporter
MNWFELFYKFLGGLGIFFFGMKFLSEGLQAVGGPLIKRVISTLTTNRILAVLVGTFVTTLVQSSSVTTVMVVGLVNAGLMELTQAIGIILGANIGTTITGWIIAIKVGKYGLLFVGLGIFPMLFAHRDNFKQIGKVCVALGFIFLGLEFMSGAFKPLRSNEGFLAMVQYFSADHLGSLIACIGMGALLTMIIQSSSAMLGVTIALASTGAITFQTAAALVLGENIGTTITALLASIPANTEAKRAARAHAFFNVIGVSFMIPLFWWYVPMVEGLISGSVTQTGPDGSFVNVAAHIALAHSLFNVTNSLLFIPFLPWLARLVVLITPKPKTKEVSRLLHLNSDIQIPPSLALAASEKEMIVFSEMVSEALKETQSVILESEKSQQAAENINRIEDECDDRQRDITVYLTRTQQGTLTNKESIQSQSLIRVADEMESITDYCAAIVRYKNRITGTEQFTPDALAELKEYSDGVLRYFERVLECFRERKQWNVSEMRAELYILRDQANEIRQNHEERQNQGRCMALTGMIYSDIVVALRKINGHILNVAESMAGSSGKSGAME